MKRSAWSEPALAVAILQAAGALIVALGLSLTAKQTGAIEAAIAAAGALVVAASVRPFQVPALLGLLTAAGTVLVAFGIHHITSGQVSAFSATLAVIVAGIVRAQVIPAAHSPLPPAEPPV